MKTWDQIKLRNFALWVIIVLLLLSLFALFQNPAYRTATNPIPFSQFLNQVDKGHVRDVVMQGQEILGAYTDGRSFQTYAPSANDPSLQRLYQKGVVITARPTGDTVPWFVSLLAAWLPFIALIGVWIFLSRRIQGTMVKAKPTPDEIDDLRRQIDEVRKRLDRIDKGRS